MADDILGDLARLIDQRSEDLLARWRAQVRELPAAKNLDVPTLNDHVPQLLTEIVHALRVGSDETIAHALREGSPPTHGLQRVRDGFDIEEVVAEYNILRDCVHDLAEGAGLTLQGRPFHVLNRVLDGAIGVAVQTHAAHKALEVRHRREEYLAFVAHDLRTPLNAIALSGRVLEAVLDQASADTPQTTQMLKTLTRNVGHLRALVDKVLDENSHLETEVGIRLVRRKFDLWPLVESLVHDIQPIAGSGTTQLVNAVPDEFVVYADATLLRRVFQNLIANAIAYTPNGRVVVGAAAVAGGGAECYVRDNGAGIPADRRARLFDKREADSERQGSLGLGLAIVKTFVEAHDGTVEVESELGAGTTFRVTLPGRT